jgi:uncharacterized membrane protein
MWGPAPWWGPLWGFGWIFPVMGLLICLFFVIAMVRMMRGGGRFMCMGPHSEKTARLRSEVENLREQMKKQGAMR